MSEGAHVGFVGLGTMGAPMAGHLLKGNRTVMVWNRTATKADPLREKGARVAESLSELGAVCDLIFICVNRTEDVQACVDEIAQTAQPGTLLVDHSTIAPPAAQAIHEDLASKGLRFVDAPITGGSMGAINAQLTIFCGGEEADIQMAMPSMRCYAKRAERTGGPGAGQMAKMANQIAVGAALLGLCESLSFAEKAGLDVAQMKDMIGGGAGGSWAFDNYGPKLLARDWTPGFSVKNQRKDFGYCREAAEQIHAAIPGTLLVDRLLAHLEASGRGEDATVALYEVLAGLDLEA